MATITMYRDINVDDAFLPVFAAVGYGTSIVSTATDTTSTWTARALSSSANWNSVAYGNKQMVAVAGGPSTSASTGVGSATATWTARTLPASREWQSVLYGTSKFVVIANGSTSTATSPDGITWSTGGVMPSAAAWYNLAYGNSTFVAVSTTNSTAAAYSTNEGASWNSATLPAAKNWQSVTYGNGKFIAISYGTTNVAISTDGTSWSAAGSMPNARNWSSIAWGNPGGTANGIFVATAYGTAVGAISTDNGSNWTEVPLGPNVVINGSFTGNATGWTLGSGWSYASNQVTHAASGGTATVTPTPALTIVTATLYEVTYTVSGVTAGTVTVNLGGTNGTARSTSGTFTEVITTSSTANLTFTPTTTFDGSIDDISVRYAANWNCISYGESSAQGIKVFTVTGYTTASTLVSFDGSNWFLKTISSAANWKYHCFAPITWNSGDTLSVQNNATITVSTNQSKFWKTFTATYGKLRIQNTSTSVPLNYYMGRVSGATANDITPVTGAFNIEISGNWIELGTGDGTAGQTITGSYTDYIPSLWIETASGSGVYEIWNNVSGASGPYMKMFGRTGLEWVGSGKRGNYFVQTPNPTLIASANFTLAAGVTTIQSYYVTCTSTAGVFPGATITGTNVPASTVVNRVVDSTTLELNAVCTATGSSITFTIFNPAQSQWTSTLNFGDGVNGNVIPSGAKVRQPNIMFSDVTAANLISASHLVGALINLGNGGSIDARICLFGEAYLNLAQASAVYFRNVGFNYQWALSECYDVDMDYVGNATGPTIWYYSAKWIVRDPRYGVLPPFGYTASTASQNVSMSYIHNAVVKNWHKVTYCTSYFTGTTFLMPIELSYSDDTVWENIRSVSLNATRTIRAFNLLIRVYRGTFTNLELYGSAPFQMITSDNNNFTNIEYAPDLTRPIQAFKTGMRLSEDASGTLLTDNVPVYIKTRSFYTWNSRETYFESGEYSATPFQNSWLFPDTISIRPTESVPASVTFNWTQREPTAASTTAYEIHRSTSAGFTTRDATTAVFRSPTPATVTFVNGPRTSAVSSASRVLTFAAAKTITASGAGAGSFITDGFVVGDVVDVSGSASNNGTYTINTLTATVMTVNETLVAEVGNAAPVITIAGRPPVINTKYYYRMRKFHTITTHVDCSVASGSTTMTTTNVDTNWGFDRLYAATDFYFDSGTTIIRNRKLNLFATPFYLGATITGTGIQAGTTITYIDAAGQKFNISQATTQAGTNVTITLPVQAGMAIALLINRPNAGIPYGTTVASVESDTSLTLSQAATADYGYVSNGTFTGSATGWTLGAGWSYGSNAVTHTSGTTTLVPNPAVNIVIGGVYTLTYTISGVSAGTVTPTLGGVAGTVRSTNGRFIQAITATTTGNLIFTPTTTFNGTIDDVSIGLTTSFLPFTESPELVATPHDYTSATNYVLQSRTLATSWTASGITATNANTYQAPSDVTWATPATSTSLLSTTTPGTLTQSVTGLTISNVYSASIWVRADQTATLPNGVAGSLKWGSGGGLVTTNFTATTDWQKINAYAFTATATSHNIVITINTTGQTIWVADAMVTDGTSTSATVTTTTTAVTLKPCAIPITTLYSYARSSDMVGSTGHQGIHVTFGAAPAGSYYHEVYLSTTSGFTPSDATLVARTWALSDAAPFAITSSNNNNFKTITKLPYGGSSSAATTGIFYLTANSNGNAVVDVDIDYDYCNTTAIPAIHLVTPAQNNVFHNLNFGRVANYLAVSTLWHSTAANSVTGNRLQNIYAKHYDYNFNDQTLAGKFKGIASGNSWPATNSSVYTFGAGVDDLTLVKTAAYGSMFNELYFTDTKGALVIVMEDTQGVKPYTTTGSPRFSNTGRLYMPTINESITITWPWKIKGVTGFRDVMPRLSGLDYGTNNIFLDSLKMEYKINTGGWTILTANNLVAEGAQDATNGFDFVVRITPQYFMKFSTLPIGTMTTYTIASPGVITTNATTWTTGQKVMYVTTGTPFGGLTNETSYYLIVVTTTTFQLETSPGSGGLTLTSDTGSGVHTFTALFEVGETILGSLSFATADVTEVYYDTTTTGTLVVNNIVGSWVAGESIKTPDNKATKALNVATNSFALGPQYTSYISALQIGTWVDQTKKYDAAIVTVTLTNIVPGSTYYIYNTNTSEQIATGTATGTPGPGETTIDYAVSVVYEADFDVTVNVRKSSAPSKYLPYESGSTVTSSGANVFIAQVIDTVVLDSYGSISSDWTVDLILKTVKHTSGSTVYTVKQLYSWLLDYFDELGVVDDQIPMSASTPTEYNLINNWLIDDASFPYLSGGSVTTIGQSGEVYLLTIQASGYTSAVAGDIGKLVHNVGSTHTATLIAYDNSLRKWWVRKVLGTITAEALTITSGTGAGTTTSVATGESTWSNIYTLGSLVSGTTLDVYQNDSQITPWWSSGHIDVMVKVTESGTEIDSGNLTVLARLYSTLYDHFVIDASSGRNPIPLAAFTDGNNQTSSGTVSGYSGITFTFGYTSKDFGNGNGARPYDVIIDCNNHSLQHVYEYLKYATRSGSATTLNAVDGEYYTGVGDIRFAYDTEASGPFTEGERINGTSNAYGYLVSLQDAGSTGYLTLRNVHGTFVDNMALTGATSGATALVNGGVTTITPQKQAPFGSFAGGQFFGAHGVWLSNVATADSNNYQLIDATDTTQAPPTGIVLKVSGLVVGDRVSMFRTTGDNEIVDKSVYTSHASNNTLGSGTFEVQGSISADTPTLGGNLRVVHRSNTGAILSEETYVYTSWTGSTFTLSNTLSMTYSGDDTAFVPYIDTEAVSSSTQVAVTYPGSDRNVVTSVRKKGIVPFTVKGVVESTGLTVTAIRTTDTIAE